MEPLAPADPRTVGRYRLSARLGAGGMGQVFFGRSPGGRPVAVKLIHAAHAADERFRRRFRLEIEAARRVGGFHTTPVVDADPDPPSGPPWMVTAYVAGPSLADVLAEHGSLPAGTLRVLGAGLAEALEAIHRAGVVHRDLKPSNILLADDGPRVIDFGIARAVDASGVTARAGTAGFMAPELLTGDSPGPASDVFAFGLVLAHAAGVRPFGQGPAQALDYRIVHQEPDLTGLAADLYELVSTCLEKAPERRPTPGQILDRLADPASDGWLPTPVATMLTAYQASVPADAEARTSVTPGADTGQEATQAQPSDVPVFSSRIRASKVISSRLGMLHVLFAVCVAYSYVFANDTLPNSLETAQFIVTGIALGLFLIIVAQTVTMLTELVMPRRLDIGPEGVSIVWGTRRARYAWHEIGALEVAGTGQLGLRPTLMLWQNTQSWRPPAHEPPRLGKTPGRPPWRDRKTGWIRICYIDQLRHGRALEDLLERETRWAPPNS
ncbi:serine/threonine-protein kinase [Actinomadura fulvescens]